MSAACLDESTVLAFLGGTLAAAVRADAEAHIAVCSACAEIATWAAAEMAGGSRAPGREGHAFLGQLAPGSHVGRYQILGPVGRGGMGEVYAAYHPDLDRRIALKVVHEAGADTAERRARLLREARAIARLSHPNVVTVQDAGTVGDRVYIAMEFVDGETLDEWLKTAPRSWRQILDVFVAAGRGLAAAHAADIVHRDFKPQNVMIGKDGVVRVMDFGLARMVLEEVEVGGEPHTGADPKMGAGTDDGDAGTATKVTKTGALLGTPAYMAPEQFRGESTDARADQFSFCVALYEALYGARPTMAHLHAKDGREAERPDRSDSLRRGGSPTWLRGIVLRGLAPLRDKRFDSMDRLLAALTHGRTRTRRRLSAMAAGLVIVLGTFGGWRLSHARRFDCKLPVDRVAAAWALGDQSNARRQSIRAALLAVSGREGTTLWDRLSSDLDEYVGRWSAMYREACEATHLRGEQSEEVLDLRMRCLNENLDEVRALTNVLTSADGAAAAQAPTAVTGLTPVARCADVRLLRSAVPLPRDEHTLRAVESLQRSLKELRALYDTGRHREALARAIALRPEAEATGYTPILAELLEATGRNQINIADSEVAEATLYEALIRAEAGGDDITLAKVATHLAYVTGYCQGRHQDGERWARFANAVLDRQGPGHAQLRAWALQNEAALYVEEGDFRRARELFERAVVLKEGALGADHPDVAVSLSGLGIVLTELGDPQKGLELEDRAVRIIAKRAGAFGWVFSNRGESLRRLGRYAEARADFERSLGLQQSDRDLAYPLTGLGEIDIAGGNPTAAVPLLERALRIRKEKEPDATYVATTEFALARALWESGGDRPRARALARSAREVYLTRRRPEKVGEVDVWLAAHVGSHH